MTLADLIAVSPKSSVGMRERARQIFARHRYPSLKSSWPQAAGDQPWRAMLMFLAFAWNAASAKFFSANSASIAAANRRAAQACHGASERLAAGVRKAVCEISGGSQRRDVVPARRLAWREASPNRNSSIRAGRGLLVAETEALLLDRPKNHNRQHRSADILSSRHVAVEAVTVAETSVGLASMLCSTSLRRRHRSIKP